ncbi:MAG: glycosyltransferase family 4 protein [Candidatus Firestonebacteria bacterium]
MKLVFLTQYFPPEIGAPQARLFELARGLKNKGHEVTIVTAFPNYPGGKILFGYKLRPFMEEDMEGLKVIRTWIYPSHGRSFIRRLLNYFSFVFSSMFFGIFKLGKHDVLICETPPLFLGISAYILSRLKGSKMYLYVSDLWPASAVVLGMLKSKMLIRVSERLERFLYRKSKKIIAVTKGIKEIIEEDSALKDKVFVVTNGADTAFFTPSDKMAARKFAGLPGDKFIVMYSGNHGLAQGLSTVLKCAKKTAADKNILYVFAGDGVEKPVLIAEKERERLNNVAFLKSFKKKEMPLVLSGADAAVIPLKNIKLFEKALPSKMFEIMSMGIPVILGVKGEAAELIKEGDCGINIAPEDENSMEKAVLELYNSKELRERFGKNGREYVNLHFSREKIINRFEGLL